MYSVVLNLRTLDGVAKQQRYFAHNHVVDEIAARRPKRALYNVDSYALGQILESPWRVGEESGTGAGPEPGIGMAKSFPPRPRLACRLRVKLQLLGTRDQLNGRAGVVQKASHIKR